MRVGTIQAPELKELAEQKSLPFANMLRSYALEDMLLRISDSEYCDHLWLTDDGMLGEEGCRREGESVCTYYYIESTRTLPEGKLVPGQKLNCPLTEHFAQQVFAPENSAEIHWRSEVSASSGEIWLKLDAFYREMHVPITMKLRPLVSEGLRPEKKAFDAIAIPGRVLTYWKYAAEDRLSRDLFEIMDKLELIGDMGAYDRVYQTTCTQALSGRRMLEELSELAEHSPQVKKERRLEQVAGYRDYAYMRKRWDQYAKRHGAVSTSWENVLERILALVTPLWTCLCRDEIFFDDWMPELGRYM